MIFLKFEDYVLEISDEIDDCTGCIYKKEHYNHNLNHPGDTCKLSAHIEENYNISCGNEGMIFIKNKLISTLNKL